MLTRIDTGQLKRAHPVEEVVCRYGIELRPVGRALVGRCPFHADGGRPNLHVYPGNASWYCYRCTSGGDVISFVMRLEGLGFRDAVARRVGGVTAAERVTGGVNSDFTAVLDTGSGRFFCKATSATSRTAWMLRNELTVHPHLPDVAPALHWHVDTGNWLALGFEHVDGRHPDFHAGSPDIAPTGASARR